ncbi:MAG: DegV family protein [Oscillospiraceae bacterium]|nr:DegV family protein [Oscillospiraceae bacterium]
MSDFVIIPDASSDLTKELRERFHIPDYIRGTIYYPDGKEYSVGLDWELMDPVTFYTSMSGRKTLYKTASAQRGDIIAVYENQLKAGKDILAVTLSSALSGTNQVCHKVAEELLKKYPQRKIIIVDSLRYSTALSLLVIKASQKQQEGATLEETAAYLENIKHLIHQIGPMDDMFFLVKTGRVSNFKAFFGTLIGINPMADFNRKGLSQVLGKFKGKKRAFDAVIEYIRGTIENPQEQIIFVAHSNREQAAQMLAQRVQEEFSPKEIIINHVGMSCGASIGPGLCAVFYEGRDISENMEYEQALMNEIIDNQNN